MKIIRRNRHLSAMAEMVFDPCLIYSITRLARQNCPAGFGKQTIALKLVKAFGSAGLFAVEMFIDINDDVLVNETTPRVHNSGHR